MTVFRSKWLENPPVAAQATDKTDKRPANVPGGAEKVPDKTDKRGFGGFVGSVSGPSPENRDHEVQHSARVREAVRDDEADAQARAAGLLVLVSGRVYYASPSRLAGVFVQRDGDTWEAYAVTWRPARQGTAGELMMAEDRTLYRGRELARALRAAVRWAGGGERP